MKTFVERLKRWSEPLRAYFRRKMSQIHYSVYLFLICIALLHADSAATIYTPMIIVDEDIKPFVPKIILDIMLGYTNIFAEKGRITIHLYFVFVIHTFLVFKMVQFFIRKKWELGFLQLCWVLLIPHVAGLFAAYHFLLYFSPN